MATKIYGKLKKDIRLDTEGKEANGGRLFLRGEFAAVDPSLAEAVDARAKPAPRRRLPMLDKQVLPESGKAAKALAAENEKLKARVNELEEQITKPK